jgi:energy-coupling factor transporter ATP-binding protein EcfA2
MFHAGLVSADRRGVLFLGPSGSGKTTLAAALLSCGAAIHTDDQVLMWYADGKTYWDGLRRPLNLRPIVARAFFHEERISTLRPYLPTSDKLALDVWQGICAIPDPVNEIAHCIVLGSSRDRDARDDAELRDLRTHLAAPIDSLSLSLPGVSSPADFRLRVMDRLKGLTHVGTGTRN